ncbi:FkbM family methyltransferase [Sphingomonas sp. LB-2]|uniref:FkbM family methyltransferase n=1 Tax=Sphingomonas caeni TaxID=2984949 RepID=UPI00223295DA|nr:FkbM family methyltransferase [Sphingomonas caeni]MCW3848453.1 FkbM family methyltransferase [Sphingomonas caeni]
MSLVNRALQRGGELLQRAGLAVGRIETPGSRAAGLSLQWRRDPPEVTRGAVVETRAEGHKVRFFVADGSDVIQRHHLRGSFYEAEELALLAPYFKGGLFVDAGANVGNHSLYAMLVLGAERVIAFEPNPPALRVLDLNLALNGLSEKVTVHRVGLGDGPGRASIHLPHANLGGAWMVPGAEGAFEIVAGDTLLKDEPVAFLKIDTEGLEMQVLAGLRATIAAHRPAIFVEVEDRNIPAFEAFCREIGYRTEKTYKRYAVNTNFLMVPDKPAPAKRRAPRSKKQGN